MRGKSGAPGSVCVPAARRPHDELFVPRPFGRSVRGRAGARSRSPFAGMNGNSSRLEPAQPFAQVVEHRVELDAAAVLVELPRLALVDRAVERVTSSQISSSASRKRRRISDRCTSAGRSATRSLHCAFARLRDEPVAIFLQHRQRAAQQVAEIVAEIAVVALAHLLDRIEKSLPNGASRSRK